MSVPFLTEKRMLELMALALITRVKCLGVVEGPYIGFDQVTYPIDAGRVRQAEAMDFYRDVAMQAADAMSERIGPEAVFGVLNIPIRWCHGYRDEKLMIRLAVATDVVNGEQLGRFDVLVRRKWA